VLAWLKAAPEPGFVWLHFNLADAAAEAWIRQNLDVVPEFYEALHQGSRSTRIEDANDTLVAIVNDVAFEFAFDPSEIETLWLHVGPRMAVSARIHPLRSIDRLRLPPPWMAPQDRDGLRQATEAFTLVIRDLSELKERIKLLQEEIAAQIGEQTNRSIFTLMVVTVLALPINIVAGLLGMNVGGIPLAQDPHGFYVIVAIIISFTVLAGWLAFRKKD